MVIKIQQKTTGKIQNGSGDVHLKKKCFIYIYVRKQIQKL